jgi:cytochrome P450
MESVQGFNPFDNGQDLQLDRLAELRSQCPVARLETGQYLLTRDDAVHEILRDGGERQRHFTHEGGMRAAGVVVPPEERLINEIDGPLHTRRRKLLMTALHPHLIAAAEPFVRDLSGRLLQPIIERGGGDLVSEFTQPLPGMVIAHVLGLPPEDYPQFKAWGEEIVEGTYPTLNRNERGEGLHGAHPEFSAYIDGIVADRRKTPREDLFTRMALPDADGDALTDTEIRVMVMFLVVAGHETTTHLIGNLLEHLISHPSKYARLVADPSLITRAVEESLRRDPPVVMQPATCVNAFTRRGVTIDPGERAVVSVTSANRDPEIYADPDGFSIDRSEPAPHNSFGGGPHFCPGAPLARLEARVATRVFLDLVHDARLAPDYQREKVPVFWANGPTRLPITVRALALDATPG